MWKRPLRDGRIRSFDLVSKMLRYFMRKVIGKRATFRPKLLLALPGGMAPSERQTLVDVLVDAGVRSVVPVDESVASAIGAGMRIDQPYGRMNIDIGGGRTNVSVFSFGHQIVWDILNVGGDRFDDAIIDYLRKKHNLLIGARTAEELKIEVCCRGERLHETLAAVRAAHPYEEPVINVIPLAATGLEE